MKYLGIDTATGTASVALAIDGQISETVLGQDCRQSAMIISAIDDLLKANGIVKGDLHGVACVAGPGSFTGLRVGMCTAKALSYSTNSRMYSVSALQCMAWQVLSMGNQGKVCVMMDARNDQVYMGCYELVDGQEPQPISEDEAGSVNDLLPKALDLLGNDCMLAGTGIYAHREMVPSTAIVIEDVIRPSAGAASAIAHYMEERGCYADPVTAAPNYLRKSQAERAREVGN